jgi:hypothetical protein
VELKMFDRTPLKMNTTGDDQGGDAGDQGPYRTAEAPRWCISAIRPFGMIRR